MPNKYGTGINSILFSQYSNNNYGNHNNSDKCDDIIIINSNICHSELNAIAYTGISGGKSVPVIDNVNVHNFQKSKFEVPIKLEDTEIVNCEQVSFSFHSE